MRKQILDYCTKESQNYFEKKMQRKNTQLRLQRMSSEVIIGTQRKRNSPLRLPRFYPNDVEKMKTLPNPIILGKSSSFTRKLAESSVLENNFLKNDDFENEESTEDIDSEMKDHSLLDSGGDLNVNDLLFSSENLDSKHKSLILENTLLNSFTDIELLKNDISQELDENDDSSNKLMIEDEPIVIQQNSVSDIFGSSSSLHQISKKIISSSPSSPPSSPSSSPPSYYSSKNKFVKIASSSPYSTSFSNKNKTSDNDDIMKDIYKENDIASMYKDNGEEVENEMLSMYKESMEENDSENGEEVEDEMLSMYKENVQENDTKIGEMYFDVDKNQVDSISPRLIKSNSPPSTFERNTVNFFMSSPTFDNPENILFEQKNKNLHNRHSKKTIVKEPLHMERKSDVVTEKEKILNEKMKILEEREKAIKKMEQKYKKKEEKLEEYKKRISMNIDKGKIPLYKNLEKLEKIKIGENLKDAYQENFHPSVNHKIVDNNDQSTTTEEEKNFYDFNENFQILIEKLDKLQNSYQVNEDELIDINTKLVRLGVDFSNTAVRYGKIIISEVKQPLHLKTIKPGIFIYFCYLLFLFFIYFFTYFYFFFIYYFIFF